MAREGFVLTKELIARAALWVIKMMESSEKFFAEYANQGLGICVVDKDKEPLYQLSFKVEKWPSGVDFSQKAEKIARMICREKKNSKNLSLTPARIKKGDHIGPGGIWSSECDLGIGVYGFLQKYINDEVARHFLVKIKALCDIDFDKKQNIT